MKNKSTLYYAFGLVKGHNLEDVEVIEPWSHRSYLNREITCGLHPGTFTEFPLYGDVRGILTRNNTWVYSVQGGHMHVTLTLTMTLTLTKNKCKAES